MVNPKLLPVGHPLGTLPGVGVAYKLAEALVAHSSPRGIADQQLDLVALGIVADVALQIGDTRFLLHAVLLRCATPGDWACKSCYNWPASTPPG